MRHHSVAMCRLPCNKTVEDGTNIEWSTAEVFAFRSLALEKIRVRVSGQDVERGAFSQRVPSSLLSYSAGSARDQYSSMQGIS